MAGSEGTGDGGAGAAGAGETDDEKRDRVMRRLGEILQGPPPETGGAGPVTGGGLAEAIAALGLGLSDEDAEKIAGAVGQGPDPDEAAAMFRTMLTGFQEWKRREGG